MMMLVLLFALLQQIRQLSAQTDAVVGVAAMHVESGRTLHVRGTDRFPMASIFKVPVALTLLRQVDQGKISLTDEITITPDDFAPGWSPLRDEAKGKPVTESVGRLLERMLGESDNTAADVLMARVGGPAAVTRRLRELGIRGIRVDRDEKQMAADLRRVGGERFARDPRDTATPDAELALLLKIHRGQDGLSAESREIALRLMTETATGPRRLKAGLPADVLLAHKTGTVRGTVNDAGIITSADGRNHVIVVVFTKRAKKTSTEANEDVIAKIGRAVWEEWTR